jgi:eukaryotic-like serine/threonine-protein kinase
MHFDIIHAVDPATRHQYAVKMGRSNGNGGDNRQEHLLRNEWKATRRLTHPNLLRYHFLGRKDRLPYLVMDFAEAANLRTYLSRLLPEGMKAVTTRDMFAMRAWMENTIVQMVTVVMFIHSRGILHLDIKPENFLILNGTDVRLIDFTNARYGFWARFGRPNAISGTPAYISPEQIRLEKPQAASDIYSLGATIYFMLTGAPPFTGHSTQEILARHLNARPVPLADIIPGLRRPFGQLVDKMLAKNAGERLANLSTLKNEIIQNGIFPHLAR